MTEMQRVVTTLVAGREHGGTYEVRCDTSVVRSRHTGASKNMNSTNGRTFTGEGEGVRKDQWDQMKV